MKNSQRLTALLAAAALGLIAVIAAQAATARVHEQPAPTAKCASSTAAVSAADLRLPQRMLVDKFRFHPGVVTTGTRSFTARVHVADTCGRSVAGARVWSTAIPYNQVDVVTGTTAGDGWATMTFDIQRGFPANPGRQQILAVLVRASKPGDSVLTGVSTRRVLRLDVNLHR